MALRNFRKVFPTLTKHRQNHLVFPKDHNKVQISTSVEELDELIANMIKDVFKCKYS